MKRIIYSLSTVALVSPLFASAQIAQGPSGGRFELLLSNILVFTNTVLIPFIIGIGFLVFVFGMFRYFIAGGADEEARKSGKSLMIFATLGFVLIIVFWGIINLLTSSTGLQGDNVNNIPTVRTF
jgi:uncharacterized membrane protein YidH (DUF202 family)